MRGRNWVYDGPTINFINITWGCGKGTGVVIRGLLHGWSPRVDSSLWASLPLCPWARHITPKWLHMGMLQHSCGLSYLATGCQSHTSARVRHPLPTPVPSLQIRNIFSLGASTTWNERKHEKVMWDIVRGTLGNIRLLFVSIWWGRPSWKTCRSVFGENGDRLNILHSVLTV